MFSPKIIERAKEALTQGLLRRDPDSPEVYHVKSLTDPSRVYLVHTDAKPGTLTARWITCTCQHGRNSGGFARCYHATAVLLSIVKGRPVFVGTWAEKEQSNGN